MKKCNRCQRNVENPQVSRSCYHIVKFDLKTPLELEKVDQIYCCEPCWYHEKESEKYLNNPQYLITHWKMSINSTKFDHGEEIQKTRSDLITIYKEMKKKGNTSINLEELEELIQLRGLLEQWGSDAPINQQKKARREELERKYSGGSQNPINSEQSNSTKHNKQTERERERAI